MWTSLVILFMCLLSASVEIAGESTRAPDIEHGYMILVTQQQTRVGNQLVFTTIDGAVAYNTTIDGFEDLSYCASVGNLVYLGSPDGLVVVNLFATTYKFLRTEPVAWLDSTHQLFIGNDSAKSDQSLGDQLPNMEQFAKQFIRFGALTFSHLSQKEPKKQYNYTMVFIRELRTTKSNYVQVMMVPPLVGAGDSNLYYIAGYNPYSDSLWISVFDQHLNNIVNADLKLTCRPLTSRKYLTFITMVVECMDGYRLITVNGNLQVMVNQPLKLSNVYYVYLTAQFDSFYVITDQGVGEYTLSSGQLTSLSPTVPACLFVL